MSRHERRAAKSSGNRMVYHKAMLVRHGGHWRALTGQYAMRLKEQLADFVPPNEGIGEPPAQFFRVLESCPPDGTKTTCVKSDSVMEDGSAVFDIGGVHVQQQYLWGITSQWGENVEWRATAWHDPVYALHDGEVVGFVKGLRPPGVATA